MRPWARRVLSSSSTWHHSSTLRGSALGTGIWTRCCTTRTGLWPGAWLACHARFRHVAEHHLGTRPRDGTGTVFPHQPQSTDWPARRWDPAGPAVLDGLASNAPPLPTHVLHRHNDMLRRGCNRCVGVRIEGLRRVHLSRRNASAEHRHRVHRRTPRINTCPHRRD